MMAKLYPLIFRPLFRRYLWGGNNLRQVLNKPTGEEPCAESWEIVDHGDDQSIVSEGPLAGRSLSEIVKKYSRELFGQHAANCGSSFPLLLKFLDAAAPLSLQVHPNDQQAAKLDPPDLGKTEAWLILAASPGSKIYAGLKRGFDRQALQQKINRGTLELCLHSFEPKVGDCIFIPAGTVHAIGAGLLVAEIQQASDTTFRLFDWNRLGADGKPRQLHIQQALEVIDYAAGPVTPQVPIATEFNHVERLIACDRFVLDRWQFDSIQVLLTDHRFHIVVVLQGEIELLTGTNRSKLSPGATILIPAELNDLSLVSISEKSAVVLDIYLPD